MHEEPSRIYGDQEPLTIAGAWGSVTARVVTATHLVLDGLITVDGAARRVRATAVRRDERWQLADVSGAVEEPVARALLALLADTSASPAQMRRIYELAARNRDAMTDGLRQLHTIADEHATRQEALARVLIPGTARRERAEAQARQRRAQATFLAARIENLGGRAAVETGPHPG